LRADDAAVVAADRDLHAKAAVEARRRAAQLDEAQRASGDAMAVLVGDVERLTLQLQHCTCGAASSLGASLPSPAGPVPPSSGSATGKAKRSWFAKK
jgi:hypothetical protein